MEYPLQLTSGPSLGANLVTGVCRLCVSVTGECAQLFSQISIKAFAGDCGLGIAQFKLNNPGKKSTRLYHEEPPRQEVAIR